MRVLLVTDWPGDGGGVETYVTLVARGLRAGGDEVRLLTSSVGAGKERADYVAFGTRRTLPQTVLQVANPAAARTVRRAVAELDPDVVLVSMFELYLSPSVLAALRNVPTVLSVAYYKPVCPNGLKLLPDDSLCAVQPGAVCWRGGCVPRAHWLRDRPRYARIRRGVASAASVLACSRWLQRQLAAAGIDAEWAWWPVESPSPGFRRAEAAEPLFVFVGRLAREKGVETLLRALALARRETAARLRVVGDGPLRPSLERLTAELRLGDVVEFTGWLPLGEIEAQLVDAWALVAPSLWAEPLGLTAVEAVVRGIPAVVSATGGLAETVEHGVTGLLFPNGDVAALAACLVDVASRQAFADGLAPDAVKRARADHDVAGHAEWLRARFEAVAA